MKKSLQWLGLPVLAAATLVALGSARGAVPVRLDAPAPAAPTTVSSGAGAISSGSQYRRTVELSVVPDTNEEFLRITTDPATTMTRARKALGLWRTLQEESRNAENQ